MVSPLTRYFPSKNHSLVLDVLVLGLRVWNHLSPNIVVCSWIPVLSITLFDMGEQCWTHHKLDFLAFDSARTTWIYTPGRPNVHPYIVSHGKANGNILRCFFPMDIDLAKGYNHTLQQFAT